MMGVGHVTERRAWGNALLYVSSRFSYGCDTVG